MTRVHDDGPRVWGMLEKVIHLVQIERVVAAPSAPAVDSNK